MCILDPSTKTNSIDRIRLHLDCISTYGFNYIMNSALNDRARKAIEALSEDTGSFWSDSVIPVLDKPTSLVFLREAVCQYRPVILKGLLDEWPARTKWTKEYLIQKMGNKEVSVNLTSDGRADSVKKVRYGDNPEVNEEKEYFVYPAETRMSMGEFYRLLESKDGPCVPYLSQQNDNLRRDCSDLLEDICMPNPWQDPASPVVKPSSIFNDESLHLYKLAHEAFGSSSGLEAANLWIGDERSVSSVHKDHFENLYAVISGTKTFTLLPPTDCAFMPEKEFPTLRYEVVDNVLNSSSLTLQLTDKNCPSSTLSWIPLDSAHREAAIQQYPSFALAHPVHCEVRAGEVLYIPPMWYHRVSQTELTVAVNFWYDQRFDFRFDDFL